jgi:hypothetical protein
VPYGPLSMSWANEICVADAEERAIVLGVMNASGYAFNAWLPLLTYPAQQAPRFKKGFIYSTIAFVAQFGITGLVAFLHNRETGMKQMTEEDLEQTPVGIEGRTAFRAKLLHLGTASLDSSKIGHNLNASLGGRKILTSHNSVGS